MLTAASHLFFHEIVLPNRYSIMLFSTSVLHLFALPRSSESPFTHMHTPIHTVHTPAHESPPNARCYRTHKPLISSPLLSPVVPGPSIHAWCQHIKHSAPSLCRVLSHGTMCLYGYPDACREHQDPRQPDTSSRQGWAIA